MVIVRGAVQKNETSDSFTAAVQGISAGGKMVGPAKPRTCMEKAYVAKAKVQMLQGYSILKQHRPHLV